MWTKWGGETVYTNITMTLERVEMMAEGTNFFILAVSPQYLSESGDRMHLPWTGVAHGYYIVDGIRKNLRPSSVNYGEDGVEHRYTQQDPIPSEAKALTLTITSWGDWDGPWEFRVPLD